MIGIGMRRADDAKMPTHDDDQAMTDQDLDQPATRRDLRALEMRLDAKFDAKLANLDAKLDGRTAELRRHFDLTAEAFRAEFRNLFDWTNATATSLGTRLDRVETSHESRLTSVELRVTRLERRRKPH